MKIMIHRNFYQKWFINRELNDNSLNSHVEDVEELMFFINSYNFGYLKEF